MCIELAADMPIWLRHKTDSAIYQRRRLESIPSSIRSQASTSSCRSILLSIYNLASLFVFPSFYEGFGLPPLEAMACGTPVVCSNVGPIPEIVADAAITKNPDDIEGLFEAVKTVLIEEDKRNNLIKLGYINTQRFTWEACASEVDKLYQRILR